MVNLKTILIFILILTLAACASWKKQQYTGTGPQVAETLPAQVPQDLDASGMQEFYHIPPASRVKPSPPPPTTPPIKTSNPNPTATVVQEKEEKNPYPANYYPVPNEVHDNMHN